MTRRLVTTLSQAYACNEHGAFVQMHRKRPPQQGSVDEPRYESLAWFDLLLEGGLVLPDPELKDGTAEPRALTMLITGGAGTGKSTLALELCTRWSGTKQRLDEVELPGLNSLYISAETNRQWALQKAKELKWPGRDHLIYHNDPNARPGSNPRFDARKQCYVRVDSVNDFVEYLLENIPSKLKLTGAALQAALKNAADIEVSDTTIEAVLANLRSDSGRLQRKLEREIEVLGLDVLVIDSLNSIGTTETKQKVLERFGRLVRSKLKVIVLILDTQDPRTSNWTYLADVVLRVDVVHDADYLIRKIEVVKARYQSHVWGVHQLKFSRPTLELDQSVQLELLKAVNGGVDQKTLEDLRDQLEIQRRAHPFRREGGICIYPSIPYHLSLYKRSSHEAPGQFSTGLDALDKALGGESGLRDGEIGGFPRHRCTGLVGMRGGHKSHLGYLSLLSHVLGGDSKESKAIAADKNRALIISLRDDESMARRTLHRILEEEFRIEQPERRLLELELGGQLEIQFFPPGHITAEEFYHRVLMSVLRLKGDGPASSGQKPKDVALLFNSLDQLASRFPLCANERIFLPGMIETLTAESVTSIFIGVDERGQPEQQYGLLSMADALMSFEKTDVKRADYIGHVQEHRNLSPEAVKRLEETLPAICRPVTLDVVRFAGGQAAKPGGILELIDAAEPWIQAVYGRRYGLCFIPFSPKHSRRLAPDG